MQPLSLRNVRRPPCLGRWAVFVSLLALAAAPTGESVTRTLTTSLTVDALPSGCFTVTATFVVS